MTTKLTTARDREALKVLGKLTIGSNTIANSSGVLIVEGKEQISLEYAGNSGQLLMNADLYDERGKRIARFHRNAWAFVQDRYDFTTKPESLTVTEKATGAVVIEVKVAGKDAIDVPRAQFFTPSGVAIRVEPTYLQIAGLQLSGNRIEAAGGAIEISAGGIGIGKG